MQDAKQDGRMTEERRCGKIRPFVTAVPCLNRGCQSFAFIRRKPWCYNAVPSGLNLQKRRRRKQSALVAQPFQYVTVNVVS